MKKILLLLLALFIFQSCFQAPQNRYPASIDLRDLLTFDPNNLSEGQQKQLNLFKENVLKFMLEATYKTDKDKIALFNQAQDYVLKTGPLVANNILKGLSEGDEGFYPLARAPQWTLATEVEFLSDQVKDLPISVVPNDIKKLEALFLLQNLDLPEGLAGDLITSKEELKEMVKAVKEAKTNRALTLQVVNLFEERLEPYFEKIRNAGEQLGKNKKITFYDKKLEDLIKRFLTFYYTNVDLDVHKDIISDVLALGKAPTDDELIKIMFNNSGPGLGKSLQQFAKEPSMDKSMKAIIGFLEDDGKEVPYYLVKELLENDPGGYEFISVSEKPLGTGTIAQVHKGVFMTPEGVEEEVAIRFIKPGVSDRAQKDIMLLAKFIDTVRAELAKKNLPDISELLRGVEQILYDDLNIPETVEKQLRAKAIIEQTIKITHEDGEKSLVNIRVPQVYEAPKNQSKSQVMVMELIVGGKKFEKLTEKKAQVAVGRSMVRYWFTEALFKSGFIHVDLHQGNFMTLLHEGTNELSVYILDFGMSIDLDDKIKRSFLLIGAGAELGDLKIVARGLSLISSKDAKEILQLIIGDADMSTQKVPADKWVTWATRKGIILSDQLAALARGGQLVNQIPFKIGHTKIAKEEIKKLTISSFVKSMYKKAYRIPLKIVDFYHIGKAFIVNRSIAMKNACMLRFQKFFSKGKQK